MLSFVGLALGFPLGVALALARSSKLPAIQVIAIIFIKVVRGVPLVSILFMASVMLPLFMPDGLTVDKLLQAQIAIIIFAGASIAETVRASLRDTNWQGIAVIEGYVFAALVYAVFSYAIGSYSRYLERRLKTDHERSAPGGGRGPQGRRLCFSDRRRRPSRLDTGHAFGRGASRTFLRAPCAWISGCPPPLPPPCRPPTPSTSS